MSKRLRKWLAILTLQAGIFSFGGSEALAGPGPEYPSPAKFWSGQEYTDFYFVYFNTHLALPHLRNPASRALFERLIDRGNIEHIVSAPGHIQDKQRELAVVMSATGGIRAAYNLAVIIGEPLQEELTRVQVFHLYLIGAIADIADQDITDRNFASALKTAWLGVVRSLSETNIYSPAQIVALSDAAARRYPALSALFPTRERMLLNIRISELQLKQAEPQSRLALAKLLATVNGN